MSKLNRFAVLLAGVTLAFAAWTQTASADEGDPPSRVARLSYIHGDVSFVPAGENDWVQAQLNRPLVTGDKLFADGGARAALEIGSASIRMDQNTNFDFLNLDDNNAQVELTQGALNLRVRRLYDGQNYEIDTPTLAFVVSRVGEFRVDVMPNGQATVVTVLSGGGDVYGEGGARFRVEEGQSVTFNDSQLQNYAVNDLPSPDAFDDFCHQRDQRMNASTSRRYVSEEVIGYEDLDDYGSWDDAPTYGHVWYPTSVAVGWSPYHYGHWGWVGAYGWSWIDDAPWGFAPFHYGRWVYVGDRWGWCPGRIDVRPVYAPALVAFVGGRIGGVNVSIGIGEPIGWFPLGYGDPYIPSYHVSQAYFTNVNVSNTVINTTVVNNYYGNYSAGNVNYGQITYANRNVAGAVSAVPVSAFVAAKPVASAAVAVNRETFANSRVAGFAAVAPTRASLAPQVAARAVPAAAVVNRPIVAATKPPAPVAAFATRQATLEKNPGQPLAVHQLRTTATATGAAAASTATRPNMKVVTQGAPVKATAPVLPMKTGVSARTGTATPVTATSATAVQNGRTVSPTTNKLPAVQSGRQVESANVQGNAQQKSQLNSSRFAHPAAGGETPTTGNAAMATQSRSVQNAQVHTQSTTTTSQHNKPVQPEYHAPTQTQQQSHTPVQTQQQHTPVQTQQQVQEYHKPAQPQYHAPVQQQSTAPQTQQYHVQQQSQQVAPQHTTPQTQSQPQSHTQQQQTQQHGQQHDNKKDKDKDKDH